MIDVIINLEVEITKCQTAINLEIVLLSVEMLAFALCGPPWKNLTSMVFKRYTHSPYCQSATPKTRDGRTAKRDIFKYWEQDDECEKWYHKRVLDLKASDGKLKAYRLDKVAQDSWFDTFTKLVRQSTKGSPKVCRISKAIPWLTRKKYWNVSHDSWNVQTRL